METFVNDTPKLILRTGIDLNPFTDLFIKFKRPNGSKGLWTAAISIVNDTWMEYQILAGDLNMAGVWTVQSHAESAGAHLHGKWVNFTVYDPLAETSTPPTTLAPTTLP